jgi:hypothetical protein
MNKRNRERLDSLTENMGGRLSAEKLAEVIIPKKVDRFEDVTEAVRMLVRNGASLSLRRKVIGLPMKARGIKTLGAADFVAKTYGLSVVNHDVR